VPITPDFTELAPTWKVTKDIIDDQCASKEINPKCTQASKTCTTPGGTQSINGLDITKDCWEWTSNFVCLDPGAANSECGALSSDPTCKLMDSACAKDATGKPDCTITTNTYKCQTNAGNTVTETVCGKTTCIAGVCIQNDEGNDHDFAKTVTMLELQRQAAMYKDNIDGLMFKGVGNTCEKRLFGASNCCAGKVVAGADNSAITNLAMAFAYEGVKYLGSKYVYDPLMEQAKALYGEAISALYGTAAANTAADGALVSAVDGGSALATTGGGIDTSLGSGAYGVNESATSFVTDGTTSTAVDASCTAANTADAGSAAAAGSSGFSFGAYGVTVNFTQLASAISNGTSMMDAFSFSPWGLALAVAIKVITEMMTCDEQEQLLSMRKGSGLCAYVGSYTRGDIYKRKFEGYCCFNSKIARIVQEQGRPQLGKDFGNPENPDCSGLSQADIEGIDFSKIDFSEFLADVTSKAVNTSAMTSRAVARLTANPTTGGPVSGTPIINPVIAQDVPNGTKKPISPEQLADLYSRIQPPPVAPPTTPTAQASAGGCDAPSTYEVKSGGCLDTATNQYYYPNGGGVMPCSPGLVKDSERAACVDPATNQYYYLNSTTAMPCKPSYFWDSVLSQCVDVGIKPGP
jgi:conjugal transfer mating pair stabilization protein TraN